jgi:hypothetical protein
VDRLLSPSDAIICAQARHHADRRAEHAAGLELRWDQAADGAVLLWVDHVLRRDPRSITRSIRTELGAVADDIDGDESFGIYLLVAACRPGPG